MNCKEINNWIGIASDAELLLPNEIIVEHLHACDNCNTKASAIQQSLRFMNTQKKETLSNKKTTQIIEHLISEKNFQSTKQLNNNLIFSRIAAVLVIAFGLLIGIVAGGILFDDSNTEDNPWSSEFTLLSDNTDYLLFNYEK